ncbi:ISAzo13 family transposase [Roseimaritima sediminicola]|uniref:ISAzo13 family transposase n=1 Tax=Roseimaritima sediminicola TaxID=2662066 RepID=UPI001EEF551C|nr:ISAzo13 family transposase [Roseimaritima sediminicola]
MEFRTAGDPDEEDIVYTDLSPQDLSERLTKMGTPVGRDAIAQWLDDAGIRRRQIRKDIPGGEHPDRDCQFERIAELVSQYEIAGEPWFSIDTKAKEHLGLLYRKGRVRGNRSFEAFDHDFPSWADGVLIPHGIFDPKANLGHINLGLSHDTSEFACESFRRFWNTFGHRRYPDAKSILLTCDGGGSNSASKYIFKYDLERLSDSIGLPIRIAHYPPYCSKYNPIERRFFPHVGRACSGMLFDCLDTAVSLMRRARTRTGLRTTVAVIKRMFETGRNATKEMKNNLRIVYDDLLPKWNYVANPQT